MRHKMTQQRRKACVRRAAIKPPLLLLFRLLCRPDTTGLMALDSAARDSRLRTRRALITVLALAFHFSGSPIWLFGGHYYFSALSTPRRCVIFAQNDASPQFPFISALRRGHDSTGKRARGEVDRLLRKRRKLERAQNVDVCNNVDLAQPDVYSFCSRYAPKQNRESSARSFVSNEGPFRRVVARSCLHVSFSGAE